MERDTEVQTTLAMFRDATWELDNIYSLFPKSCGLSEVEYWSLLLIYDGVVTQSQISDRLFISRQTLNSAFKQLRKKGLIRLVPYEENQRTKRSFLTDAGKAFVEEHILRMHRMEERAWCRLTSEEHKALIGLTQKISRLMRDELEHTNTNIV